MVKVDELLIKRLKQIEPYATTEIVMQAALNTGAHYATVQRYLRGEVKKPPYGKILLEALIALLHAKGIDFSNEDSESTTDILC